MATHTFEAMFSHSAAAPQRKQKVGNKDIDQVSVMTPVMATLPERRREARMDYRRMCSYAVFKPIEGKSVVIEQGEAFALNRSTEGILLLMGQAPHAKQLIELHTPRAGWGRTVTVFKVRWVKPVQVESLGSLYLVGCQRVFDSCHHLLFDPLTATDG
ncbi:MAG: hypothetical protein CAF43_004025 [Nitrospira sp. CG24C]|nr:MAG: hypothetical protein CAF43_004025 [Nitrospira sp. CG24C]